MAHRKPLEDGCDGSLLCEVDGHLTARRSGVWTTFAHIPLTLGQRKTLRERSKAEREATS